MIKVLTGYSERGGSTVALSNLVNFFNENGYEAKMFGPHDYHLSLCEGGKLTQEVFDNITQDDVVITHFLKLPSRPNAKKVMLACHEKWWFDVANVSQYWDAVIFLHEEHQKYHGKYKGDYHIIPNLKDVLIKREKEDLDKVAGIVGSIEDRKQTHISIQRALKDKCDKIYLFGKVGEQAYYDAFVKPLTALPKIIEYGHADNKQAMYDMVGRVYHSSKGEVACLVKDECWSTGTKFFGNEETLHKVSELTNDEILQEWVKVLEL